MATTVHDRLEPDDLARWRFACAEYNAVQDNPQAFDADESTKIHLRYFEVSGELVQYYDIPAEEPYSISPYTGAILIDD